MHKSEVETSIEENKRILRNLRHFQEALRNQLEFLTDFLELDFRMPYDYGAIYRLQNGRGKLRF